MSDVVAILDACVLYPATLRDLLVELAWQRIYVGKWTEEIHAEWMRNLRINRPDLDPLKLERTRRLMDRSVRGALITGHESLISSLALPDPDDRHVLAAAIYARADVIVTLNLRDFPPDALSPYGIEAQHPDAFLTSLILASLDRIGTIVEEICRRLKSPPTTVGEYLGALERQGLIRAVGHLRDWFDADPPSDLPLADD